MQAIYLPMMDFLSNLIALNLKNKMELKLALKLVYSVTVPFRSSSGLL